MRTLFSVFFLTLFYVSTAFGQATVDIPLTVTDGTITIPLAVGLDLSATDGLDIDLGESDLPPFPPLGAFEFRFDLSPYAGEALSSYKDYRAPGNPPGFPFTGTIEHTMWWQTSATGLDIVITYDLPANAELRIVDPLGGSILNIGPLVGSGMTTIPGSYTAVLSKAFLYMDYSAILLWN